MKQKEITLKKGKVIIYSFGEVTLHAYLTNDPIDDVCILLEKNGKLVVIESPLFYDNNEELEQYIRQLNVKLEGILLSYHMGGGNFEKESKKFGTKKSEEYGTHGGGKNLVDNFSKIFGEGIDGSIHHLTDYIHQKEFILANIEFRMIETQEGFDLEIPEINSIYTHMLGSDCHSIVMGREHAKLLIQTLEGYLEKNYNLILTSHYKPEGIEAVKTKIVYLKRLVTIADNTGNVETFKEKVKQEFPNYSGLNYLDMSAPAFF